MASKPKLTGRAKSSKPTAETELATLKKKLETLETEVNLLRNNFDRSKLPKDLIDNQDIDSIYKDSYFLALEELKKLKEETTVGALEELKSLKEEKGIGPDVDMLKEKYQKLQYELTQADKERNFAVERVHLLNTRISELEEENRQLRRNSMRTIVKPK